MDDGKNGYTIYFGSGKSSDYMRINIKNGIPNLQFMIFNVKGDFRGKVVTPNPTPAPTTIRYSYGTITGT